MLSEDQFPNFKFKLGIKLKDRISGVEGVSVARTQYLSGCNHYSLQRPGVDKDGKLWDWLNFNEDMLKLVVDKPVAEMSNPRNGGPAFQDPPRM